MKEKAKKTAVMTIRMTAETKRVIDREAERREWTPSKMAEKILSAWAMEQSEQESANAAESNDKDINVGFYHNEINTVNIT